MPVGEMPVLILLLMLLLSRTLQLNDVTTTVLVHTAYTVYGCTILLYTYNGCYYFLYSELMLLLTRTYS